MGHAKISFLLEGHGIRIGGEAVREGYCYLGEGMYGKFTVFLDPFEGELIIAEGYYGEVYGSKRYVYKFKEDELEAIREACKPYGYPSLKDKNYAGVF